MSKVSLNIPLNRVEGDLDINVVLENNQIIEAKSIGTLYRGFENMLTGRDPMDALVITPRICGICSITHLTAAVKAIEQAVNIKPPAQAVRMRNLSLLAETVQSDLRQVFLMFMSDFAHSYYKDQSFYPLAVEQYAPLTGKGAIDALRQSKDIVKVIAIIGGQWPHTSHMVPGGICTIPSIIDMTLVANHIENVLQWYEESILGCSLQAFEQEITSADKLKQHVSKNANSHLANFVQMCEQAGLTEIGRSYANFISYGVVDDPNNPQESLIPAGIAIDGCEFQSLDLEKVGEDLSHSWYQYKEVVQNPFAGSTQPDREAKNGYTWAKAPRYSGQPMQTGPIAQAIVAQDPLIISLFNQQGDSVFVRQLARLLRPAKHLKYLRQQVTDCLNHFGDSSYQQPLEIDSGYGVGITEAARGALGHWLEIKHGEISNYQIVTPTAWNASPLDSENQHGPWEKAILGLTIKDTDNPMEMGHVIRSFDPCLVCTVHAMGDVEATKRWTFGVF